MKPLPCGNAGRSAMPLTPSCPSIPATSPTSRTCPPALLATMPLSLSNTSPVGRPPSRSSPPCNAGRNAAVVRGNVNTTRNAAENGSPVTSAMASRVCDLPTGRSTPVCHQSVCASSPGR
ncbi:MAG: hypothetical protein JWO60_3396 [Frankiales bacterium]|nr:hypothetical protein [Frankiales bacterium]